MSLSNPSEAVEWTFLPKIVRKIHEYIMLSAFQLLQTGQNSLDVGFVLHMIRLALGQVAFAQMPPDLKWSKSISYHSIDNHVTTGGI